MCTVLYSTGKKTPGGAGTHTGHTGHTGTDGHTDTGTGKVWGLRRRAPAMHVYMFRVSYTAAFASAWLASLCFSDTNQRAAW